MPKTSESKVSFREYTHFFGRYLRGRMHLLIILGVTLFAGIGLQIVNPQIMRVFLDKAMAGGNLPYLQKLAALSWQSRCAGLRHPGWSTATSTRCC